MCHVSGGIRQLQLAGSLPGVICSLAGGSAFYRLFTRHDSRDRSALLQLFLPRIPWRSLTPNLGRAAPRRARKNTTFPSISQCLLSIDVRFGAQLQIGVKGGP